MEADYIEQVSLYRGLLDIEIRKVQRLSEELQHARHTIEALEQKQQQRQQQQEEWEREDVVDNTELDARSVSVQREDVSHGSAHELEAARQQIAELQEALAAQETVRQDAPIAGSKRKRSNVEHSENLQQLHERAGKEASSAPSFSRSTGSTDEPSYRSIDATQTTSSESVEAGNHSDTTEDSTKPHEISEADIKASHESGLLSILKVSTGPDAEQYEEITSLSLTVQRKVSQVERLLEDGTMVDYCRNTTSMKCLRGAISSSGIMFWTKEHPGGYACLTCTNMQLPCIAKNLKTGDWELLPLVPDVFSAEIAEDNNASYVLVARSGKFTKSIAGRKFRFLWRENPKKAPPKLATRSLKSLVRKT
ncbi:hypothetical protein LTR17_003243 [Elasticomyces elasticus]|nr:hypothetical protein LTR17_003243 [Elasticomyces elasticus]